MSRTRKTAPWRVKMFYKDSYVEAVHRHETHECDLPPKPGPKECLHGLRWNGKTEESCFWYPSHEFYRSDWAKCPCYMCSYDAYQTPRNLRERREGKRYSRDGWKDEY